MGQQKVSSLIIARYKKNNRMRPHKSIKSTNNWAKLNFIDPMGSCFCCACRLKMANASGTFHRDHNLIDFRFMNVGGVHLKKCRARRFLEKHHFSFLFAIVYQIGWIINLIYNSRNVHDTEITIKRLALCIRDTHMLVNEHSFYNIIISNVFFLFTGSWIMWQFLSSIHFMFKG